MQRDVRVHVLSYDIYAKFSLLFSFSFEGISPLLIS